MSHDPEQGGSGQDDKRGWTDPLRERRMKVFMQELKRIADMNGVTNGDITQAMVNKFWNGPGDEFNFGKWVDRVVAGEVVQVLDVEIAELFEVCKCDPWQRQKLLLILDVYQLGLAPETITDEQVWFELCVAHLRRAFTNMIKDQEVAEVLAQNNGLAASIGLSTIQAIINDMVLNGFRPDGSILLEPVDGPVRNRKSNRKDRG